MEIISILDFNNFISHFNIKKIQSRVCLLVPIYKLLAAHTQFNGSLGSVPADYLKKTILMKKSAVFKQPHSPTRQFEGFGCFLSLTDPYQANIYTHTDNINGELSNVFVPKCHELLNTLQQVHYRECIIAALCFHREAYSRDQVAQLNTGHHWQGMP